MISDNLGPAEAWTIKAFPRDLRRKIIQEAAHAGLSVGEYVTQLIVRGAPPAAPSPSAPPPQASFADVRDLMEAAQALRQATDSPMPKRTAGRLYRYLDDRVRVQIGLAPRKPRPLRIAAADSPTPVESDVPATVAP